MNLTFTMPARPTLEDEDKYYEQVFARRQAAGVLAESLVDVTPPLQVWQQRSAKVLLNALTHMTAGEARAVLKDASERLNETINDLPLSKSA